LNVPGFAAAIAHKLAIRGPPEVHLLLPIGPRAIPHDMTFRPLLAVHRPPVRSPSQIDAPSTLSLPVRS
jgi:hypothetical protein